MNSGVDKKLTMDRFVKLKVEKSAVEAIRGDQGGSSRKIREALLQICAELKKFRIRAGVKKCSIEKTKDSGRNNKFADLLFNAYRDAIKSQREKDTFHKNILKIEQKDMKLQERLDKMSETQRLFYNQNEAATIERRVREKQKNKKPK